MFNIIVGTVIVEDDKVLMVKETKEDVKGLLNFPAGRLEKDETLIEGTLREIKEETGLNAVITQFIDMQFFTKKGMDCVAFVFQGKLINDNKNSFNNELEFDFYDIEYLKSNTNILRNEKLIINALNKINQGNCDVINIFKLR